MPKTLSNVEAQYTKFFNTSRTFKEFSCGDLVLLKTNLLNKAPQFEQLWSGRFKFQGSTSNLTYRFEVKHHQRFHPVVYVGIAKPLLTSSTSQKGHDNGTTPEVVPPALSVKTLSDKPVSPPTLSQFQESEPILKKYSSQWSLLPHEIEIYHPVSWCNMGKWEVMWCWLP